MSDSQPRIFVAIAAYCDPILPWTLDDCLSKARNPENLRFGVCWQYDKHAPIDLSSLQGRSPLPFLGTSL